LLLTDDNGSDSPLRGLPRLRESRCSQRLASPHSVSPQPAASQQDPVRPASPQPGPSSAPDQPVQSADPVTSSLEDVELDEDVLNLLGDAPKTDKPLGKVIHKDVASRWQEILNKGLSKDIKDKLAQEYLVPNNCNMLVPPTLNPEAKAALPDALVKRDASLMIRQKQIALAMSALAQATDILIKQKFSASEVLKPISDAARVLCDAHFNETKMRRNFVISAINTNLKEALISSERDTFLFGENVSEKLKAAQAIQKSGSTLKNTQRHNNQFNKANFAYKNKNQRGNLNYKTLHRKSPNQNKTDAGRSRAARPAPRYNTRYRAKERSRSPPPPRKSYRK
jgi:hypothetical protein